MPTPERNMKSIPRPLVVLFNFISQPVIILLLAALLVYGFFIPFLGFYWDDLMLQWISQTMGPAGLARYFSTNRPVWGLFYQITTSLLGDAPWKWQVFAIFWRWLAAVGLFSLGKQIWQRQTPALLAALLFLTYPGFGQQYIATVYGHFSLVLTAFFFSLTLSLIAAQTIQRKRFWAFSVLSLILSAINLFSMEYFFMLEVIRPLLIGLVLREKTPQRKQHLMSVLKHWAPYLFLFLAAGIWRAFLFDYQTNNYEVGLLVLLREQPFQTIGLLLGTILRDVWQTVLAVWKLVVQFPSPAAFGQRSWLIMLIFSLAVLIFSSVVFRWRARKPEPSAEKRTLTLTLWLGLAALLLGGIPFWVTRIPVGLSFPNDRFTLPFIMGVALVWVSIILLLPIKRWLQISILLLVVSLSAAYQLRLGVQFQRDWEQQTRFFWQLVWRIPALEENTILFAHELPFRYFSDNSLTGGLNWIYAQSGQPIDQIPYVLYYPTVRVGLAVKTLTANEPVEQNLLVGDFYGNTSHSLALFYQPPACLRILDPELEPDNWMVPLQVRETIHLTDWSVIQPTPQHLPPSIYGAEPTHGWCYYFQKADLARQQGDWVEVKRLGEIAFQLDDHPNDPLERFPFIEAYAHLGQWDTALDKSQQSAAVSPVIHPALCRLWDRIKRNTPDTEEKTSTIKRALEPLQCKLQP